MQLEAGVSVNARCHIDGGNRGIVIGASTRLGPGCYLFAFNHGIDPTMDIKDQPVSSEGITIGQDCWVSCILFICFLHLCGSSCTQFNHSPGDSSCISIP